MRAFVFFEQKCINLHVKIALTRVIFESHACVRMLRDFIYVTIKTYSRPLKKSIKYGRTSTPGHSVL